LQFWGIPIENIVGILMIAILVYNGYWWCIASTTYNLTLFMYDIGLLFNLGFKCSSRIRTTDSAFPTNGTARSFRDCPPPVSSKLRPVLSEVDPIAVGFDQQTCGFRWF
jgi:hypothetical protein